MRHATQAQFKRWAPVVAGSKAVRATKDAPPANDEELKNYDDLDRAYREKSARLFDEKTTPEERVELGRQLQNIALEMLADLSAALKKAGVL